MPFFLKYLIVPYMKMTINVVNAPTNGSTRYISQATTEEILDDVIAREEKGYTPIFDKVEFGCGGTYSFLNIADEWLAKRRVRLIVATPNVSGIVNKQHNRLFNTSERNVAFVYGGNKYFDGSFRKFYCTPDQVVYQKDKFRSILPLDERYIIIQDEYHSAIYDRSYRNVLSKIEKLDLPHLMLGLTATVPVSEQGNVNYKLLNIDKRDISYTEVRFEKEPPISPDWEPEEDIQINVVDQSFNYFWKEFKTNFNQTSKVPCLLIFSDFTQVNKVLSLCEHTHQDTKQFGKGLKVKQFCGGSNDLFWKDFGQFQPRCLTKDETEADLFIGTVSATEGIDIMLKCDLAKVYVNMDSGADYIPGLFRERMLQAGGRFREAKKVEVFYTRGLTDLGIAEICEGVKTKIKQGQATHSDFQRTFGVLKLDQLEGGFIEDKQLYEALMYCKKTDDLNHSVQLKGETFGLGASYLGPDMLVCHLDNLKSDKQYYNSIVWRKSRLYKGYSEYKQLIKLLLVKHVKPKKLSDKVETELGPIQLELHPDKIVEITKYPTFGKDTDPDEITAADLKTLLLTKRELPVDKYGKEFFERYFHGRYFKVKIPDRAKEESFFRRLSKSLNGSKVNIKHHVYKDSEGKYSLFVVHLKSESTFKLKSRIEDLAVYPVQFG